MTRFPRSVMTTNRLGHIESGIEKLAGSRGDLAVRLELEEAAP